MVSRNSWFDGQQVSDVDLNTEQDAWLAGTTNAVNISVGSGVEKEFAVQRTLFDSDSVPVSITSLMQTPAFDGCPIFQTDVYGLPVFIQPSDASGGNQLEVILTGSGLLGSATVKIYIFGKIFGGLFSYEVLTFVKNESQTTQKYFTEIISIMTQDFMGNQNDIVTGTPCGVAGGRIQILETVSMTVVRDAVMAEQSAEPNMDFVDFKPANVSKNLNQVLEEIAAVDSLDVNDLQINVTATGTRKLLPSVGGVIVGQKFKATTGNIQKVSTLLSVEDDAVYGFSWSGSIVLGIRQLQSTVTCQTDIVPGTSIEFDPYPVSLAEISFTQNDLENLGVILTDVPQVVDFVFATSTIANSSTLTGIETDKFYMVTVSRSGDIREGTIVLEEASNITADTSSMRLSVFSQNTWTDVVGSNLWFKVYTSAARVTSGTAYDNGIQIVSPKIELNSETGVEESHNENHHSLLSTSYTTDNYVIVQASNNFTTSVPHPATGNPIFTRVEDVPDISVVSKTSLNTLIDAGNDTIILGNIKDDNRTAKNNIVLSGQTIYPGLAGASTFTIINPPQEILSNNLVGSILTPNINLSALKYRIIYSEIFDDKYGDVNGDGIINDSDVTANLMLDGYSLSIFPDDQLDAIVDGYISMAEIIRADVSGNGTVSLADAVLIQQYINLGTPFPAGNTFKRIELTVESIFDPLNTSVDIVGNDPLFNTVVLEEFQALTYQIKIVSIWNPENIVITDMRRFISRTFTSGISDSNGGTNTSFISGDILLSGNIGNEDGTPYSIDLEVGTIVLEMPASEPSGEIDIFNNFIRNRMKFFDGTFVSQEALENNQVMVSASIQSITKNLTWPDVSADGDIPDIDFSVSVLYVQDSGLLKFRIGSEPVSVSTRPELRTKIVLTVYLKKAGFKNTEQTISGDEIESLMTIY